MYEWIDRMLSETLSRQFRAYWDVVDQEYLWEDSRGFLNLRLVAQPHGDDDDAGAAVKREQLALPQMDGQTHAQTLVELSLDEV